MAIDFIAQKKKQKYLLALLVLILLVVGGVVWYGFSHTIAEKLFEFAAPPIERIEIDLGIFEHPIFSELRDLRPAIPFPQVVGREEPFTPIESEETRELKEP